MSPAVPPAAPPVRGKLEQAWLCVGLFLVMLLGGMTAERTAHPSADAPHCQLADQVQDSAQKLCAVEGETQDEDAASDMQVVASGFGLEPTSDHGGLLERVIAADIGHLLVSTGLGRGPPVG